MSTEISKNISYHLRHHPEELGLALDPESWVDLDVFLRNFNRKYTSTEPLDLQKIQQILQSSDKQRWQLDNNQIRAKYGHTVAEIELKYPILQANIQLFHGTTWAALPTIKKQGLKPMSRLFVHLTDNHELAVKTAQRKATQVEVLTIDVAKLCQTQDVLVAGNGVYLTKEILPEFIIFQEQV